MSEGYLLIDHRASPGLTKEEYLRLISLGHNVPFVPEGTQVELKTKRCSHCGTPVVLNPLRTRERGHCHKCDKYLCDTCAVNYKLTDECHPVEALADKIFTDKQPTRSITNV